jgi:hypothetical protein
VEHLANGIPMCDEVTLLPELAEVEAAHPLQLGTACHLVAGGRVVMKLHDCSEVG